MSIAEVINAINDHVVSRCMHGPHLFPTVEREESLEGFTKQDTEIALFDYELVKQKGCADYGHYGELAYPIGSGLVIVFEYYD